jgi:bacterial/archaeal transporter family protein
MTLAELWQDWRVSVALTALCWGVSGFFSKIAVERLGWPTATLVASLGGLLAVAPMVAKGFSWPGLLAIWPALACGLGWSLGSLLLLRALERGPSVAVLPMSEAWLVVSTLLALCFLGEHLTWMRSLGLLLVLAGATLLAR